jgi:hypothetical protein
VGEQVTIPGFQLLDLDLRQIQAENRMVERSKRVLRESEMIAERVNDTQEKQGAGIAQASALGLNHLQAEPANSIYSSIAAADSSGRLFWIAIRRSSRILNRVALITLAPAGAL